MDNVFAFMDAFLQSEPSTLTLTQEQMQTVRDLVAIHWEAQQKRINLLEQERAVHTAALGFYGEAENWEPPFPYEGYAGTLKCRIEADGGEIARQALAWTPAPAERK